MKKILLSAVSLAVLTGSALAADLPTRKEPAYIPPPPPMWTGFYGGLNVGGGWDAGNGNGNAWNLLGQNGGVTNGLSGGVIGGGQVGYNYQIGGAGLGGLGSGFLIGAEADFQGTSMGNPTPQSNYFFNGWGPAASTSLNWFGTVRGRVGILAMPTLLIYGTGGFNYGNVSRVGGVLGWVNNGSNTQTGWTAGGGVEWMFLPNWSTKVEYLYSDISGSNSNTWGGNWGTNINNVNNHTRWNTVRAGLNYHFNWGAAPIVAKY